MQAQQVRPKVSGSKVSGRANVAAAVAFAVIVIVLMVIALVNAPVKTNPLIARSLELYLEQVRLTAVPFLTAVAILGVIIGLYAARAVRQAWDKPGQRAELLAAYGFLAPYLLVLLTFTLGVLFFAFYVSFTDYGIFTEPKWVGLDNYRRAFTSRTFQQSLYNVFWFAFIVTFAQTAIAIALAVLLNAPIRFKQFFRTIFYAPSVTSSVVITLIFIWLYLKTGYINYWIATMLGWFGQTWAPIDWLGDPRGLFQIIVAWFGVAIPSEYWYLRGPSIALMSLMAMNIFTTVPTFMIMFLAALQDINPVVYEAAAIDGATGWQQFWKVTLPLLRPIIVLVLVLGTIGTLQVFDQVYLATSGGPLGTTLTPVYEVFTRALGKLGPIEMGYGAALAFILAVIIFIFTYFQRRFVEKGTQLY
ncbi:MAG: sugar ABC transporter permease [Anaerolineae bacterium]|nr:sugar ABC transporter permease [Anaerolineae bacterium]